ncbi:hypothetical protein [Gordonia zhaorongruii]|uniref:hypothetical protein n=1 Tax=Gordonia zhaorongruii TaxID=2597659 RepID=UPI00104F3CDF|nr:hypothetical protein [Gordonia zhaorongruii]
MNEPLIWPRIDRSRAESLVSLVGDMEGPPKDLTTDNFAFSGIGQRAGKKDVELLRSSVVDCAERYGFKIRHGYDQDTDPCDAGRAQFDAEVFKLIPDLMPMNWSEAGSREVWSWCALALLPDVTHWRWKWSGQRGRWNPERWIASDFTRHTWARQWWRAVQLHSAPTVVDELLESDFNQLTERANTIGASPRLVSVFAEQYLAMIPGASVERRALIRDATQRLLRELAFIDDGSLGDNEIERWVVALLTESVYELEPMR